MITPDKKNVHRKYWGTRSKTLSLENHSCFQIGLCVVLATLKLSQQRIDQPDIFVPMTAVTTSGEMSGCAVCGQTSGLAPMSIP
jgi:hypothetical protein